ncbi:site-specific DNA-methyltransferase [bacterium]|nr:site-specific DNA-methyltransferase [bacterium]
MNGKSLNITEEKLNKLKEIIPEAFTENKIDWEKLKAALGEDIEFKNERYVLNWAGKSDAFRVLQSPTTATLVPVKDESVNFDTTENIFIEGENLEVLKVLQKSYFGKIKMIYIDPPYNTGNDNFIYPDKFSETKEEYLSRIGDKDETGFMTREGLFRKNSKNSGHYHSNWLSMMYPRLFLARNLLRDDGVIFVSIDDNEVHNLRLLMNEVFGEENFVANIIWQKKYAVSADDPSIAPMHDYIVVYQKSSNFKRILLPRTEKQILRYKNIDNDPRGSWSSDNYVSNKSMEERPTLWYPIMHPKTGKEVWPDKSAVWRYSKVKHEAIEKENRLYWGPDLSYEKPRLKRFLNEIQEGIVPSTWWEFKEVGHNDEGQKETAELLGKKVFSTPKPVRLLKKILNISVDNDDIVLDFFAGSCSLGQAIFEENNSRPKGIKFICIQLPESCSNDSVAHKTGYKTIADIGKERIRRVIKKIKEEQEGKLNLDTNAAKQDLGFKVFKLQDSNFKIWQTKIENEEELNKQLEIHTDPVDENAKTENILCELLIKSGISLTAKIEQKAGVYLVNDNEIALILEKVNNKIMKKVIDAKPQKVITLDRLFNNNDQLKTNTALQMKDAGIEFKVV